MKKFLIAVVLVIALGSCEEKKDNGLRENTVIALNPGVGVKSNNPEHCSAGEIVAWASELVIKGYGRSDFSDWQRDFVNNRLLLRSSFVIFDGELCNDFLDAKDVVLNRVIYTLLGEEYYDPRINRHFDEKNRRIIVYKSVYNPDFLMELDQVYDTIKIIPMPEDITDFTNIEHTRIDTIAYIPNRIGAEVAPKIRAAYAAGDYETCYDIFDKSYEYYPITGAEWRELKRQGIE